MKDSHLMSMGLHQDLNGHSSVKHHLILAKKTREISTTPVYTELISIILDTWGCISDSLEMLKMGPVELKPYTLNS